MDWHRSTFCASGACVEVRFVKASASLANGACVEVGRCCGGVLLRDSKDPDGPTLRFTGAEWAAFLGGVAAGEFGGSDSGGG